MAEKVVVDPVTRIEGHLRIQAQLDEKNDRQNTEPPCQFSGRDLKFKPDGVG